MPENQTVLNIDTAKIIKFITSFENVCYEALAADVKNRDSVINSTPFHIITVTDINGKSTTIKTFHIKAVEGSRDYEGNPLIYNLDRLYALVNEGRDLVLIQFFAFDNILRPVTYFQKLNAKK